MQIQNITAKYETVDKDYGNSIELSRSHDLVVDTFVISSWA